jgi:hypothetical protein
MKTFINFIETDLAQRFSKSNEMKSRELQRIAENCSDQNVEINVLPQSINCQLI